jgi:hypothetical protein
MDTIINANNLIWILTGIVLSTIINSVPKRFKVISGNTLGWLFLLFTFVFLLWNASFSIQVTAISANISSGRDSMSNTDIQQLQQIAEILRILATIGIGLILGEIIFAVFKGKKRRIDERKNIVIDTESLSDTIKDIEKLKEAKNILDDFFSQVHLEGKSDRKEDKPKAENETNNEVV